MLQECWKFKVTWDAELPITIKKKFEKWKNQLNDLKDIIIPRCMTTNNDSLQNLSLHIFCDASKVAYATCIFLRTENKNSVSCQLVQARARVSPLKNYTIPRLELLACTIGARLAQSVKSDIRMPNIPNFFWSDSVNALFWIKRKENWAPFVYNRVHEIRSLSNPEDWNYVPGSMNPADLPSRGCSADHLKKSRWWEGPQWLKESPEFWPKGTIEPDYEIINSEKKKIVRTLVGVTRSQSELFENISSYLKMIKVVAWIYRFFFNLKKKNHERNFENRLIAKELNFAESILLRYAQKELLSELNPCYCNLPTFKDDMGIIRVRTRISMRNDLYSFRYPILLTNNHIVSCLIIYHHNENQHAGIQTLMSLLRESYWILRCRKTVRNILNKCIICKRFRVKPPETLGAPLPENRVKDASVYEVTGLDLCGPLFLKDNSKVWIVLFTCAIFRVIHLELVTSLSADSFILALRRFIARRGRPSIIISDNGKNLVKTSTELKSINWNSIENFASIKRIEWRHNPPASPWWGGFFERLIGMLKNILRKVLGKASLNYEELLTVLCDAEATINSRPLTYISENDKYVALTPAMFLQDIKENRVPDLDKIDSKYLRKRLLYKQKLQEDLRKRFRLEYLGQIKGFSKSNKDNTLKEGDIVLIGDDNSKRINWPLGKILKLYLGKDGKARVAAVLYKNKTMIRPLKKLFCLEVSNPFFSSRLGEKLSSVPDLGSSEVVDDDPVPDVSPGQFPVQTPPAPDPPVDSDDETATPSPSMEIAREDLISTDLRKAEVPPATQSRYGRRIKNPERMNL